MEVCFIVDGNSKIGLGHIMRCIALGKTFSKKGHNVQFYSRFEEGIVVIKENEFPVTNSLNSVDIIVVDKYDVTQLYFNEMKRYAKVVAYIDDLNMFEYNVDVLINGSLVAHDLDYKKECRKLLLATKYNILRDEFLNLDARLINDNVKDIMLTTGGSDLHYNTLKFVKLIRQNHRYDDIRLHVIIGKGFIDSRRVINEVMSYENVVAYENIKSISKIMLLSDICITAGGGTLYELCACGTPIIGFISAKNHEKVIRKMEKQNYLKNIGWYTEITGNNLYKALDELIANKEFRKEVSRKQQSLVDGKGCERIYEELMNIVHFI